MLQDSRTHGSHPPDLASNNKSLSSQPTTSCGPQHTQTPLPTKLGFLSLNSNFLVLSPTSLLALERCNSNLRPCDMSGSSASSASDCYRDSRACTGSWSLQLGDVGGQSSPHARKPGVLESIKSLFINRQTPCLSLSERRVSSSKPGCSPNLVESSCAER